MTENSIPEARPAQLDPRIIRIAGAIGRHMARADHWAQRAGQGKAATESAPRGTAG